MRILIAGANGFLGKNIRDYFHRHDHYKVNYITRSDLDLTDRLSLSDYCRLNKPDLLLHVAVSLNDFSNNILMYYALEACAPYCANIIMIGSGAEYSHQRYKSLMSEDYFDPLEPPSNNNPYHTSKHLISRLHANSSISNIFNFRVFGLYGPYEDYSRRLISNNIFNFIQTGRMAASANHSFDYLYVDDLISAVLHFVNYSSTPLFNTYNVCSGRSDSFHSILSEVIISLGGSESSIDIPQLASSLDYSGNNSRFQLEFSYSIPQTSYAVAARKIKDWLLSDPSILNS
tara:strand:+ start:3401 stop:4264 length:864 start_codon:yes stop_codon:yes gene_type:complete